MAGLTNHYAGLFVDHLLRGTALSLPSTIHFGLLTAAADNGTYTEITTTNYTTYARLAYSVTSLNWDAASAGSCTINPSADQLFPQRTDAGTAPTATILGIFDTGTLASGSTTLIAYGNLPSTLTVNLNDKPFIGDADVVFNFNAN